MGGFGDYEWSWRPLGQRKSSERYFPLSLCGEDLLGVRPRGEVLQTSLLRLVPHDLGFQGADGDPETVADEEGNEAGYAQSFRAEG